MAKDGVVASHLAGGVRFGSFASPHPNKYEGENMILTKKQALEKCVKMWDWLAKHPSLDKWDYFLAHPELERLVANCYACDFSTSYGGNCRETCIIHWPRNNCLHPESPYHRWRESENRTEAARTEAAKAVADLARQALAELSQKGIE